MAHKRTLAVVLFPQFELLDVFGPLEMWGGLPNEIEIHIVAEAAGPVSSTQGPRAVAEHGWAASPPFDLLLVPGGIGTREEVNNAALIAWLAERAQQAALIMSVCTGAALLARAGLLDGVKATTNKRAFSWVVAQGPRVHWVPEARWVRDGRYATSSGVAAGIDMTLAVIEELFGKEQSEELATRTEYDWHRDPSWDPFARIYGLGGTKASPSSAPRGNVPRD
jgi:transcriptional regulator GlxA family with amidase domain